MTAAEKREFYLLREVASAAKRHLANSRPVVHPRSEAMSDLVEALRKERRTRAELAEALDKLKEVSR